MKLLFCVECFDVFKLDTKIRSCKCGLVTGKYNDDGKTAIVNGKGMSLAINNIQLLHALHVLQHYPEETSDIDCWARPHTGEKHNPNTIIQEDL